MNVHLSGSIINPKLALYKILEVSYKKKELIKFIKESNKILFIYDGFTTINGPNKSVSSKAAFEINFNLYQLIEI